MKTLKRFFISLSYLLPLTFGITGGAQAGVTLLNVSYDPTRELYQEFNAAFVLMEYFAYLRRDPDAAGYQHWLDKLNFYGNYMDAEMVKSFITSLEYRARFGQP